MGRRPGRERPVGFSLVELLIVIAILSVLTGILLPVLASARERGRRASCQSNLKQIGLAFDLYLENNHDTYPCNGDPFLWMGRKWRWPLKPYLALNAAQDGDPMKSKGGGRNVLLCPSDRFAEGKWDGTSYSYSMTFYHSPDQINALTRIEDTWTQTIPCRPQSRSSVKYASKKALVTEWLSNHESPNVAWSSWEGGRVYLFADGHCRYLKARQIKSANDGWPDINLTRDGIRGKDID